jgi:hypothetical protein
LLKYIANSISFEYCRSLKKIKERRVMILKSSYQVKIKREEKMKRFLALAAVICLSVSAFASEQSSLRIKGMGNSLAGIVDDEYSDLMVYPSHILDIEGKRLYTNLSNLSDGTNSAEAAFGNVSANRFLIGGITKIPKIGNTFGMIESWGSLAPDPQGLVRYNDWATTLTNIDPENINEALTHDNALWGETGDDEILNNDVTASTYRNEKGKAENMTNNSILNGIIGYKINDKNKVGLAISYDKRVNETTKTNYFMDKPDTTDLTDTYSENYSNKICNNTKTLALTPELQHQYSDKLLFEIAASLMMFNDNNTDESSASAVYGNTYSGAFGPGADQADIAERKINPKGTGMGTTLVAKYDYTNDTKLTLGFSYTSSPKKDSSGEYNVSQTFAAGINSLTGPVDYDQKNTQTSIVLGAQSQLSSNLLMGIAYTMTMTDVETGIVSDSTISTLGTVAGYINKDQQTNAKTTTTNIPVGFEYSIKEIAKVRMGSTYTITKTNNEATEITTTKDTTNITITDYTKTVDKADTTVVASNFFYGTGINISENATLDILGNSNLTNLVGWQVGLNLMFD